MAVRVSRPLTYSNRFGEQQSASGGLFQLHQITFADNAIQGDPIRALVELITNCDDAYNKLSPESGREACSIEISVCEDGPAAYLTISDRAVGMDGSRMDLALGSYTSATSTGADRGYFGRGLKDGILALGRRRGGVGGERVDPPRLARHTRRPTLLRGAAPDRYAAVARRRAGTERHHGAYTRKPPRRTAAPRFSNLERQIPYHFMLRGILSNPSRHIYLSEVSQDGEVIRRKRLRYEFPNGRLVLDNSLLLRRLNIPYRVIVYEADRPLSTPRQSGPYAESGILITDGNAILDNTLGMFDADPDARSLFGRLECPHLNKLMRDNEPIVQATRHGLMWDHEVARELRLTLDERLEPLVRNIARQAVSLSRTRDAEDATQRLSLAVEAINEIARAEAGTMAPVFERIVLADASASAARVRYDFGTSTIEVNTGHPAVAPYLANATRRGVPSGQGQALLAELVLDAACAAIAGCIGSPEDAARLRDKHAERAAHGARGIRATASPTLGSAVCRSQFDISPRAGASFRPTLNRGDAMLLTGDINLTNVTDPAKPFALVVRHASRGGRGVRQPGGLPVRCGGPVPLHEQGRLAQRRLSGSARAQAGRFRRRGMR